MTEIPMVGASGSSGSTVSIPWTSVPRGGEVADVTAPLAMSMLEVHDQMVWLGGVDSKSDAPLRDAELMHVLELAGCAYWFRQWANH